MDASRAAGSRKRRGPRQPTERPPLLPPRERAALAARVLAADLPKGRLGVRRDKIDGELYRLDEACARTARVRSAKSRQAMRAMRTFLAALRRANKLIVGCRRTIGCC